MAAIGVRRRTREILRDFGLVISFALICFALALLSDRFLTVANITNVLRNAAINAIISVGMTFVILTAGIDLSVGAIVDVDAIRSRPTASLAPHRLSDATQSSAVTGAPSCARANSPRMRT